MVTVLMELLLRQDLRVTSEKILDGIGRAADAANVLAVSFAVVWLARGRSSNDLPIATAAAEVPLLELAKIERR